MDPNQLDHTHRRIFYLYKVLSLNFAHIFYLAPAQLEANQESTVFSTHAHLQLFLFFTFPSEPDGLVCLFLNNLYQLLSLMLRFPHSSLSLICRQVVSFLQLDFSWSDSSFLLPFLSLCANFPSSSSSLPLPLFLSSSLVFFFFF